jgi:hypothetical protein
MPATDEDFLFIEEVISQSNQSLKARKPFSDIIAELVSGKV